MSKKLLPSPETIPLLKPYVGAGSPRRARHINIAVFLLATLICLPYGFYYAILTPWILVPFIAPVSILLVIVIWVLPDSRAIPTETMERLLFALFAALVAWPNYLAISLPGLPWITISRLIGTPLIVLFLVSLSISEKFRSDLLAVLKDSPWVWKTMVASAVLQGISIPFSSESGVSIAKYVVHLTNETGIFFVCCYFFRKPGRAEIWAALIVALAIFVGLIGTWEFRAERVLWARNIPSFLAVGDESVTRILAGSSRATTGEYRSQSVFSTSLGFSEFMALAIPFALHFAMHSTYKPLVRIACAISVPFMVMVILNTGSRLGLLGFFLGSMMYLLLWALRLKRQNPGSLLAPTVIVAYPAFFSAFIVASFFVGKIRNHVWGTGEYNDSNQARIEQVHIGIPKVLTHPLGNGIGTAAEALGYANLAGTVTIDSYYLAVALEYGILGLATFVAIFGISAYWSAKHSLETPDEDRDVAILMPLAAAIASFLMMKAFFAQDDNHAVVYMMVGISVALIHRLRQRETHPVIVATREPQTFGMRLPAAAA